APDCLHDSGPGVSNADVSGGVRTGLHFVSFFVPNHWINSERGRPGTSWLHRIESGLRGAEETAGFGLPPGIDNHRFALADDFVIPLPDFRLDGRSEERRVGKECRCECW